MSELTDDERREAESNGRVAMAYALERLGVPQSIILEALVSAAGDAAEIDRFRADLDAEDDR